MKLTKVDIAEGLGMTYHGICDFGSFEYHYFSFLGKEIKVSHRCTEKQAWEEAAEKLLEPLVDYLLGNLDDE